ncbi:MAG: FecR family protein [Luteolibacter sp.]|uniref:FecR family protein n=1 Tax=Luteolibacter sp. TaxID=1962973 RepID=UPI003263124E
MKTSIRLILWLSGFAAGSACAAPLSEGELTKVINDVKILPVEASPLPATPGARISGKTAVSTGAQSRAELKFTDKTLTRVGANSIFRMDTKSRTVDLQKGVILLQVPKQLGGATIRTAAVTAAVTGTTVMVEYTPDGFIKIIVIEGEVDVWLNEHRGQFRTLKAGDMWITRADDKKSLPLAVQIDLERLQMTSKLLNTAEFDRIGNEKYVKEALADQRKKKDHGELIDTAFQIQGRGRNVTLLLGDREHISTPVPSKPSPHYPPMPPEPPVQRPTKAINIAGTTVFDNASTIDTASTSNAFNSGPGDYIDLPGTEYRPAEDDVFGTYAFDDPAAFPGLDQVLADRKSWYVLKGDEIYLSGNPLVNSGSAIQNVIFGATGNITFSSNTPFEGAQLPTGDTWTLDDNIRSLVFASLSGSINFDNFNLMGSSQSVELYANGLSSDVFIIGEQLAQISVPDGNFKAVAGRNIETAGASIEAQTIKLSAGGNIAVGTEASRPVNLTASKSISLKAKQSIQITSSSQLRSLSQLGNATVLIDALIGNVDVSQNSTVDADVVKVASHQGDISLKDSTVSAREIKARVFSTGGILLISDAILGHGTKASDLIRLYGEGSQGVRFVGDTTLRGTQVDIAGTTVQIDPNSQVRLLNPGGTTVYSNFHLYNDEVHGNFVNIGDGTGQVGPVQVNQQPYVNRPHY